MKSKYFLMSLDDEDNDKLANLLSNKTAKKIVAYLSENDEATPSEMAKDLGLGLSTIHYNLEQLQDVGLIEWNHYHYSKKGREVRHYKLAKQYIIIAPKKKENILETLKKILPGFVIGILGTAAIALSNLPLLLPNSESSQNMRTMDTAMESAQQQDPMLIAQLIQYPAFWFVIGCMVTLLTFFITLMLVANRRNNKNSSSYLN